LYKAESTQNGTPKNTSPLTGEEIIQFPPKKLTENEKAQVFTHKKGEVS
jgi:hypothetical protein